MILKQEYLDQYMKHYINFKTKIMAEFKELINKLCTEEMVDNGTAPIVYHNNIAGYLFAYDAGLGFSWMAVYDDEIGYELSEDELSLYEITENDNDKSVIGNRTPVIVNDKLYEFGHYIKSGCVVYEKGEFGDKKQHHFKLDEIHLPTSEELRTSNNEYYGQRRIIII